MRACCQRAKTPDHANARHQKPCRHYKPLTPLSGHLQQHSCHAPPDVFAQPPTMQQAIRHATKPHVTATHALCLTTIGSTMQHSTQLPRPLALVDHTDACVTSPTPGLWTPPVSTRHASLGHLHLAMPTTSPPPANRNSTRELRPRN